MCGIVACRTARPVSTYLVNALKKLEYRGYDSAGIAVGDPAGRVASLRTVERVADLVERLPELGRAWSGTVGIGHTRWATHGEVTTGNAHPHTDCHGRLASAHNGIIQNSWILRSQLEALGHTFTTEVDSEVIAHLVEEAMVANDLHSAVEKAVGQLEGSWAIVVMDAATGNLVAAANQSPLVLACTDDAQLVASDIGAIAEWIDDYRVLHDGDVVQVLPDSRWRHAGQPMIPRDPVACPQPSRDSRGAGHSSPSSRRRPLPASSSSRPAAMSTNSETSRSQ